MTPIAASDGYRARAGGSWQRETLAYLRKYASAFMTAMAPKRAEGKWNRLFFIDLLCGPGIDIIDGEEHRGSPLIALDTTPPFDQLFLGDLHEANVEALRRRIPADKIGRVDLQVGDCHGRAKQVVDEFAAWGDLGFAFVDPEGFEVRFELFATLSSRPIDILFLFPSGIGIKRNLSQFARQRGETLMDGLMGCRDWRQLAISRLLAGAEVT